QFERLEMEFRGHFIAGALQRLFERFQADRAPGADHVGDEVDADRDGRRGVIHGVLQSGKSISSRNPRPTSARNSGPTFIARIAWVRSHSPLRVRVAKKLM